DVADSQREAVPTRGIPFSDPDVGLAGAVFDFAEAFGAGVWEEDLRTRGLAGPSSIRAVLEELAERAGSLVTPGDLLRTPRLFDVERMAPAEPSTSETSERAWPPLLFVLHTAIADDARRLPVSLTLRTRPLLASSS